MLPSSLIFVLALVLSPLLVSASSLSRRDDVTKIVSPRAGDRISTGIDFGIRWETTATSGDVIIQLRRGEPSNISVVHTITFSTPNNGSYLWRSDDDGFLAASFYAGLPEAPTTGCEYSITVSEDETTVYSDYFAIINLNGDDLPANATCPTGTPDTNSPSSSSSDGEEGEGGGGGVTEGMLAGAVAGAAVGLLVSFAIILLVIKRKGWFVNKGYIRQRVAMAVEERIPADVEPSLPEEPTNSYAPEQNMPISVHQMPANAAEK